MSKVPRIGIFLQYIKKKCRSSFVFYYDAKYSDILGGSSHGRCYLLFIKHFRKYKRKFKGIWEVFTVLKIKNF